MMQILLLILISGLAYGATIDLSPCSINDKWLEKKLEQIEEKSEKMDVSLDVQNMKRVMNFSCPSKVRTEVVKLTDKFIKEGYKNHIVFLKNESKRISSFRSPNPEIEEISKYRLKLKQLKIKPIPDDLSQNEKSFYIKRGKKHSGGRKSTCSNVDNRKPPIAILKKNGSVKKNIMRDQDSIGWCYAYTAADLIGHKTGKRYSAIDIANAYNNDHPDFVDWLTNSPESEMEAGHIKDAIESAMKRGLCLEKQLPSDDYQFSMNSKDLLDKLKATEKLYDIYEEKVSYTEKGILFDSQKRKKGKAFWSAHNQFKDDLSCGKISSDWDHIFQNTNITALMDVLRKSSSANNFVDKLIEKSCRPRDKTQKLKVDNMVEFLWTGQDDLFEKIDTDLEKGQIIAISYRSSVLNDKNDRNSGNHGSLVVARKFNRQTGSCEYLVRNSWGTGCSSYDSNFECTEGNIWIPEEYLRPSVYGVTYVK